MVVVQTKKKGRPRQSANAAQLIEPNKQWENRKGEKFTATSPLLKHPFVCILDVVYAKSGLVRLLSGHPVDEAHAEIELKGRLVVPLKNLKVIKG
jgi:hypothetical protein